MGKIFSKILCGVLAVMFVMSVLLYGSGKAYSPWEHFRKISANLDTVPTLQEVAGIWSEASYTYSYWHKDPSYPRGGYWNTKTVYYDSYKGDNEILSFFSEIAAFFKRLYRTLLWLVEWLEAIFRMVYTLLPWNGLVDSTRISVIGEVS